MSDLIMIPVDRLEHHPRNPRKEIGDITELAQSIRESGVLQNLTVVPHLGEITGQPTGFYWVVIGNRRLEAAEAAGLETVPCIVADMTEEEQFRTMMVENMQRSDLTILEEADGFQTMLDMGDSVAEISRQTGISETKIRNRVKLAALPREDAAAGLQRGARLEDYLRLEKIQDEKRRASVLRSIGTRNFEEQLSAALRKEKDLAYIQEVRQELLRLGFAREVHQHPAGSEWTYVGNFGSWNRKTPHRPKDADTVEYVFQVCNSGSYPEIDLFRKGKAEEEKSREAQIRQKLDSDMQDLFGELDEESQRFQDLREDFILNFSRYDRHKEEILAWAARVMMTPRNSYNGTSFIEEACGALGIQWLDDRDVPEKVQLNLMTLKQPEKVLMYATYYRLENEATSPTGRMWDGDLHVSLPIKQESKSMGLLYNFLAALGYESSTEEEMWMGGGCMQYQEAEALVAKAREELGI